MAGKTNSVICRMGFHRFRSATAADGTTSERCARCGRDRAEVLESKLQTQLEQPTHWSRGHNDHYPGGGDI